MTPDKTPKDAAILDVWASFVGDPTPKLPLTDADKIEFARAVLAKWGSPVVAGVPVAWRYRMKGDLQWQYTERPEQFAHADEVQPLTTPQPTQAQAGAVPLTDPQLVACIEAAGFKTWDSRMWALKRAIEAAHGIKGGQHGTE